MQEPTPAEARRARVAAHLSRAGEQIDAEVLLSDEAWRLEDSSTTPTLMPAEQFDAMRDSLDEPDHVPTLKKLAARPRRFENR